MALDQVDPEPSVGYALKHAAATLRAALDAALRPLALSVPQYSCLELLGRRPGLSAAELARGAFVTRQSMHAVLQGLQDRGLVARSPDAPPGRPLPTRLTGPGAELLDRAGRAVAEVERRMVRTLPAGGEDRLRADLDACVAALAPDRDPRSPWSEHP